MDIKTIRKMNVRLLEREVGSLTALAKLAGTSQSYLSQCVGKGAFRAVGDELARRLEFGTKKPNGWMDQSHIEDAHMMVARQIYDKLLELPRAKLNALVELLDMVDSTEREGFLGHIDLDENSTDETKGRVITLSDTNESSEKTTKQRASSVPKRNHK